MNFFAFFLDRYFFKKDDKNSLVLSNNSFTSPQNLINDIKQEAHKRLLIYSSLEKECIDEMIEDGHYEKVIDKLQSVIEQLEGGYCKILDIIEGNEL